MARINGIEITYLGVEDLRRLGDFKNPEVPEYEWKQVGKELYETETDFDFLRLEINTAVKNRLENKPNRGYALAVKDGEVVRFSVVKGGRRITIDKQAMIIPKLQYVYVHPDYRKSDIGMSLVEESLKHHRTLYMVPGSWLGKQLVDKARRRYGHKENDYVMRMA